MIPHSPVSDTLSLSAIAVAETTYLADWFFSCSNIYCFNGDILFRRASSFELEASLNDLGITGYPVTPHKKGLTRKSAPAALTVMLET